MTTATLIHSQHPAGVRQTLVVDTPSPTIVTRVGSGKGVNWRIDTTLSTSLEVVLGKPVSIAVSALEYEALVNEGKVTQIAQRLQREQVGILMGHASAQRLGVAIAEAVSPAPQVEAEPEPEEFILPAEPEPVVAPEPVVVAPVTQVAPQQTTLAPEPVMALATGLLFPQMTDPEVAEYIPPTINGKPAVEVLDHAVATKTNCLMWGHAGVGKTSLVTWYSALRGKPLAVLEGNIAVDEEMIQGGYHPTGNPEKPFEWHDSAIVQAMRAGGVILFNEVNAMNESANSFLYRITQERKIQLTRHLGEVVEVHPDCLIIADGNRGYRGTKQLSQALNDRFGLQTTLKYDRDIERQFIPSDALLDCAFEIRSQMEAGTVRSVFGTRVLKNFVQQALALGYEFALESLLTKMQEDERPAISMIIEKDTSNICQELGIPAPAGF